MEIRVATPPGCEPLHYVVSESERFAQETGGWVLLDNDPQALVRDVDVVCADVWARMEREAEGDSRLPILRT